MIAPPAITKAPPISIGKVGNDRNTIKLMTCQTTNSVARYSPNHAPEIQRREIEKRPIAQQQRGPGEKQSNPNRTDMIVDGHAHDGVAGGLQRRGNQQ
jgi:hypothetical protein